MVRCSVLYCKSDSECKLPDLSFHSFPTNENLRQQWINATGRTKWTPKNSSRICSKHFDKNILIKKKKVTLLLPNAVPFLFLSSPPVRQATEMQVTSNMEDSSLLSGTIPFEPQPSPSSLQKLVEPGLLWKPSSTGASEHKDTDNKESCWSESEIRVLVESQTGQDPLANVEPKQCRFCFKSTENTANGKPYIEDNKTTLTLNGINIEIDFSNDTQTVCVECDKILLDTFNFAQQVKNAQSLLTKTFLEEPVETLIVKTECESPIPDDDDINENAVEVDDIPTEETVVNVFTHKKRKADTRRPTTKQKKNHVVDNKACDDSESNGNLMDIKEEDNELDDYIEMTETTIQYTYLEDRDTGPKVKPSEEDIACLDLLNATRKKQ